MVHALPLMAPESDDWPPLTCSVVDPGVIYSKSGSRCYLSSHYYPDLTLKGIDRPFRRGVKSSLIRSLFINWRLGNFFLLLILKGFHHKISKKPIDAA
jgi:hypothetical protein